MECDCLVSGLAVFFQMTGWASVAWHRLGGTQGPTRPCQAALTLSLIGLGVITLLGAMLQITCALVTGLTVTVLLLAVICPSGPQLTTDRYQAFYAMDEA